MNLILVSKKKLLTPAASYRRRITWTRRTRRLVQLSFAAFILSSSIVHQTATEDGSTAALFPFGAHQRRYGLGRSALVQFLPIPPVDLY